MNGSSVLAGFPDFFAPGVATTFVLVVLRVGGLLLIAPAWSSKQVPMRLRTALLVLLAVLLLPSALATVSDPTAVRITPATFLTESAIGFALGFAAALIVAGAEFAGELMTNTIGLSGAAILDPVNNHNGAILGAFMQVMTIVLILISGGHILMLQAVAKSFEAFPVGAPVAIGEGLHALVLSATTIFSSGMQFAAPVMAAILMTNMALSILGRAAPQLQIITVAFPLQIGVGLLTFAGTIGLIVHVLSDWTPAYRKTLDSFARAAQVAPEPAGRR